MTYLSKLKQSALSLIFIYLVIFSADVSALSEQCHHIAKILDAKANNYSELVDINRFNLQQSPFSQAGQDNVEAALSLPSAEKCQVTWVPEQAEFSYMCDWKNQNKDAASTNLNVIGDLVEMCLVESDLAYDRVNPKSMGNLSFITFYFAKETNLKIVLMKMGSRVKSSFEFSQNQLVKPRSQVSENGKYDLNVVWPELVVQSDKELQAQNQIKENQIKEKQAKEKQAQETRARQAQIEQQQALAEKRKAEQIKQTQQKKTQQKQTQQKQNVVVNTASGQAVSTPAVDKAATEVQKSTGENAATAALVQVAKTATESVSDKVSQNQAIQALANGESTIATTESDEQQQSKANLVVAKLDPNLTRCWYFASYTSAYQDQNADDQRAYEAVLISHVNYIDVEWSDALEQSFRQSLGQQAEKAWQTQKPADSYFYYNSQPFGHLSCDQDAQERIKVIRETMKSADWVGEFDATLN